MSDDRFWTWPGYKHSSVRLWTWRDYKHSSVQLTFRYWWVGVAVLAAWGAALLNVDGFADAMLVLAIPITVFWAPAWAVQWSASRQRLQEFGRLALWFVHKSTAIVLVMLVVFFVIRSYSNGAVVDVVGNGTMLDPFETVSRYLMPAIAFFAVLALVSAVRMPKIMEQSTQIQFKEVLTAEKNWLLMRPMLAVIIDGLIMTALFVCLVCVVSRAASMLGWVLNDGWCWAGAALTVFGYHWWAGCRGRSVGHMLFGAQLRSALGRSSRISTGQNAWRALLRALLIVVELAVLLVTCVWVIGFQLSHLSGPPLVMAYGMTVAVLLAPLHPRAGHLHNVAGHVSVEW